MLARFLAAFRRPVGAGAPAAAIPAVVRIPLPAKGRNRIAAAILAGTMTTGVGGLAVTKIAGGEGYSEKAYIPIRGDVPTICYGETRGIRMGMTRTRAQCDAMFLKALSHFADGVEGCVKRPMSDDTYVAFLSLAYNIGIGSAKRPAFCQSSVVRLYNAGDARGACEAMTRFNRAQGRVVKGLVNRRADERALCLRGI